MKTIFIFLIVCSGFLSFAQQNVIVNTGVPLNVFLDSCDAINARIQPGGSETDPIWTSEKIGYATLPVTVTESDPVWLSQKIGYATLPINFPAETDPGWTADKPNYATTTALTNGLANKQATLISGTNIKTVNGTTLLGSGDLVVSGSGNGYTLNFFCLTSTLATAATYYIGAEPFAASTTQTLSKVYVPKTGTIKAAYIYFRRTNGTYTSGNLVMSVNVDNVATQIASVANFNTPQVFSNAVLNIAVTAGSYVQIKVLTPTLSVSGSACFISGNIYIE